MVRERPHIHVDFLTVCCSIDKSPMAHTHVHVGVWACFTQRHTHTLICTVHSNTNLHVHTHFTLTFNLYFSFSPFPTRTDWHSHARAHALMHTFQRLSQWNVGQSRVGTKGSVTQLPIPTHSQSSFNCHPSAGVCAFVCAHKCTCRCPFLCVLARVCATVAFALHCRLCVHASGRQYVNPVIPPPTNRQTAPGLKMDLSELSALLVLAWWLCCRWIFFFSSSSYILCNSQNWFGLILNGFRTSAQRFTLKDLRMWFGPVFKCQITLHYTTCHLAWRFYPKQLTISIH